MILRCLFVAWIAGIGQIGTALNVAALPLLLFVQLFSLSLLLLHWLQLLHLPVWGKGVLLLCCSLSSFYLGHAYANQQLEQQLRYRETKISNTTVVIFVDHIAEKSQLERQQWQQKVWVIGRHAQAVRWRIQYPAQSQHPLQLGQYYRVTGQVLPHHGYVVEGVFNQEVWLLQQQYMASLQLQLLQPLSDEQRAALPQQSFVEQQQQFWPRFQRHVEAQRLSMRQWIAAGQYAQAGLMLALLTGDQSLLSEASSEQFRRLGIVHLLAISGPHILIFAVLCCVVLGKLLQYCCPRIFLSWPRPELMLWPFLCAVWWYVAFVGFEIPALRSLITINLLSVLLLLRQRLSALSLLLLSASLLLLFDPLSILSVAFWLSYGAALILLRIYLDQSAKRAAYRAKSNLKRLVAHIGLLLSTQGKIFIALLPLTLVFFQQFSYWSVLANLLAVPMIGLLVVPLLVLSMSIYRVMPSISTWLLSLSDDLLQALTHVLHGLDQTTTTPLHAVALQPIQLLGLSFAIFLLFLPRVVVPRAWVALCGLASLLGTQALTRFELTILDVGQGQASFVDTPKQRMMIDLGGNYNEAQWGIGEHVIQPFLLQRGIGELDRVIISHLDQDHRGGLSSLSKQIKIKQLISNQYDDRFVQNGYADTPFDFCKQGQVWQFDHMRVEILAPRAEQLNDVDQHKNDRSCIVYIQVPQAQGYQNFLIMGDAGWPTEYQLMQDYPDLKVDVLVLGHHGSRHSSAYDFLAWLKPKLAVISVGWNNRYGHPHPVVLARLAQLSIPVQQTSKDGSLRFYLDDQDKMQLRLGRDRRRWLRD